VTGALVAHPTSVSARVARSDVSSDGCERLARSDESADRALNITFVGPHLFEAPTHEWVVRF